jgi:hypothetical protein
MSNPLYNMFGRQQQAAQHGGYGNVFDMIQKFQQFKATFTGDPKAQVQAMLQSGQISQEQLNQAAQVANTFQSFLH